MTQRTEDQLTLTATWTRDELTADEAWRWELALDHLARQGFVRVGQMGTRWARRFCELGMLRSAYGCGDELIMTELGDELG